jgi:Bacterial protein of unknown function (DUF882)
MRALYVFLNLSMVELLAPCFGFAHTNPPAYSLTALWRNCMKLAISLVTLLLSTSTVALAAPAHARKHTPKHGHGHGERSEASKSHLHRVRLLKSDVLKSSDAKPPTFHASLKDAPNQDRHSASSAREKAAKKSALTEKKKADHRAVLHAETHGEPELEVAKRDVAKNGLIKVDLRAPSKASKDPEPKAKPETCANPAIEFYRGTQTEKLVLTQCDGTLIARSQEKLSVLVQPTPEARSQEKLSKEAKPIDGRLLHRLQAVAEHFSTGRKTPRVEIVSGYRPASKGSYHSHARAVDIRLEGVKNEDVVAYCKNLIDTGCGYYPNSSFVHVDARDAGTGHVFWIDASGPGETPRYVASWPEGTEPVKTRDSKELDAVTPREETTMQVDAPVIVRAPVTEAAFELPKPVSPDAK